METRVSIGQKKVQKNIQSSRTEQAFEIIINDTRPIIYHCTIDSNDNYYIHVVTTVCINIIESCHQAFVAIPIANLHFNSIQIFICPLGIV